MSKNIDLKLDWCGFKAANYACRNWHYSRKIPLGKLVKIGVWENGHFIGVVIFSMGTNKRRGSEVGLKPLEACELSRIALQKHLTPVSRIIKISLKMLKRAAPKLRLVISYADKNQLHLGKIYQASNWIYVGETEPTFLIKYKGEWVHARSVRTSLLGFGGKVSDHPGLSEFISNLPKKKIKGKFKYLYPLDEEIRQKITALKKPYPKELEGVNGEMSIMPEFPSGVAGAKPSLTLQTIQ